MKKRRHIFLLLLLSTILFSCKNVFQDVEKKDTDEAIYYQAQLELNKRNFDGAVFLFELLSPAVKNSRVLAANYASAYSGRCGLDFLGLVNNLETVGDFNTIYAFLLNSYPTGTASKMADCIRAEAILDAVGDFSVRNPEENLLMAFSSLVKIGTILDHYADPDDDGDVSDFDHCDTDIFPDEAVRHIGSGTANAILSAAASGTNVSDETLADITAFCGEHPDLSTFCTSTDPSAYSTDEVRVLRSALGSSDFGIGSCTGDLLACACP